MTSIYYRGAKAPAYKNWHFMVNRRHLKFQAQKKTVCSMVFRPWLLLTTTGLKHPPTKMGSSSLTKATSNFRHKKTNLKVGLMFGTRG